MGALRKRTVFWVAVLKRDPVPPVKDAIHPHPKDGAFWHMVVKNPLAKPVILMWLTDQRPELPQGAIQRSTLIAGRKACLSMTNDM
jgi:hypothetical protein